MKRARLIIIAMCLSDGGIGTNVTTKYIHFTNQSKILLDLFQKQIGCMTRRKIHVQKKARGITMRVYDKNLVEDLLKETKSFRTRPCKHHPVCPIIKGKNYMACQECQPIQINGINFPPAGINPDKLNRKEIALFLKVYASCDGYPSIFPRPESWSRIERSVAIVSHHPVLKENLSELLKKLKIEHKIKKDRIAIGKKSQIIKFKKEIGFVNGVTMTGNSKYWKGVEKNEILNKIEKSYGIKIPHGRRKICLLLKRL